MRHIYFCSTLLFLSLFCTSKLQAQNQENALIKLKINKEIGEQIQLYIETDDVGKISFTGVRNAEDLVPNADIKYTLSAKEITISGPVKRLKCIGNKASSLEVRNHPTLADLEVQKNEITHLHVEDCPQMFWLNFGDNKIEDAMISKLPKLQTLFFKNNKLKKLDLSEYPLLNKVSCDNNLIDAQAMEEMVRGIADRSAEERMGLFYAVDPTVGDKNVMNSKTSALLKNKNWQPYHRIGDTWTYYPGSATANALVLTSQKEKGKTIKLTIHSNNTPSFVGISNPEAFVNGKEVEYTVTSSWIVVEGEVTALHSRENQLTAVNIAGHSFLETLKCDDDIIEKIDARKAEKLKILSCANNKIFDLFITEVPSLVEVNCKNNYLQSLDITGASFIEKLDCSQNAIATLVIPSGTALKHVECHENQLRGESLSSFIRELPTCSANEKGKIYLLNNDVDEKRERNRCDEEQIKQLQSKNWEAFYLTEGEWKAYEGSATQKKSVIQLTSSKEKGGFMLLLIKAFGNVTIKGVSNPEIYENGLACIFYISEPTVTIEGDVQYLDCSNNELSAVVLNDCSILQSISCYDNKIERFIIKNCPTLESIICEKNSIKGENMQILAEGITDRLSLGKGKINLYNTNSLKEFNECSKKHVAMFRDKNWQVYCTKDGYEEVYEGNDVHNEDVRAAHIRIDRDASKINIHQAPALCEITLYSCEGQRVLSLNSDNAGEASFDTASLNRGVYILNIDKYTYKLSL